jgi:CubicO group peptidase (beta-lactamase class C family)
VFFCFLLILPASKNSEEVTKTPCSKRGSSFSRTILKNVIKMYKLILLKQINKRYDFHGSILVAKKRKIVYQTRLVMQILKKKILNKQSLFQLASSKQFTAAKHMLLNERGHQLTDTVDAYFPNFMKMCHY